MCCCRRLALVGHAQLRGYDLASDVATSSYMRMLPKCAEVGYGLACLLEGHEANVLQG